MKTTRKTARCAKGEIELFTLVNASGASVTLSSLGAGITDVTVPDREGHLDNVALGYADPADYLADGPCMGKIPGRYANRIARGHLEVDGKVHSLEVNCGPNHLHGGSDGFQNRLWHAEPIDGGVRFTLESPDGDACYPGAMHVTATYRWNDSGELSLELEARTDAPTVVNLTNHAYWNLDGADSGDALHHMLQLRSSMWLPTDDSLVPLGEPAHVEGSPMDFRNPKAVGRDIHCDFTPLRFGKGYDNCWILDGWEPGLMVREAARLASPRSGRVMRVSTDQPGIQIYSGNWLNGSPLNRSGRPYNDYEGIAIEAQGLPDAPNQPRFPSQRLEPGEVYRRAIIFAFGVE